MHSELEVEVIIMEQEQTEDPALATRKAELLAVLDASLSVNNDYCKPDEHSQDNPAKGKVFKSKAPLESYSLQTGGKGKSTESLKLDSTIEQCLRDPKDVSQYSCAANTTDSVKSYEMETNGVSNCFNVKYNFDTPVLALSYEKEFKMPEGNFTKGCKWSPDGSCLLVGSDDKKLRLFNLPAPVASGNFQDENWFIHESVKQSQPALTVTEGELIYDYSWYPIMHSSDPQSCCFAVTCRDFPVHLWDAWNGSLICSYQPFDHLDQLKAAHSINFSLDGSLLLCGFNRSIRMFRTSRPGRHFDAIDAKDQPGIISCMAFNPMLPSVFVAGSYLGNLGLYSTEKNNLFCRIEGCPGGITQVQFSSDGTKLFSGARKDNELLCWDVRNVGKILWRFKREVKTHQRIQFDLEPQLSRYIVSGTTSGKVLKWDLDNLDTPDEGNPISIKRSSSFVAHKDCCNGVGMNPHYPVLATTSGQRHFPEPQSLSDTDSNTEEDDRPLFTLKNSSRENTVKLWWLGGQ